MGKFDPASGDGEMDHSEEAVAELIIRGGNDAVDLDLCERARCDCTACGGPQKRRGRAFGDPCELRRRMSYDIEHAFLVMRMKGIPLISGR
jgi:hypothetical protein